MNNETQTPDSNITEPTPQKPGKKWLTFVLVAVLLIAIGAVAWIVLNKDDAKDAPQTTSFLSNNNNVACTTAQTILTCENLQTGDLQELEIPKQYQEAASILPSPDGARLLITSSQGDVVVTDGNFKEIREVYSGTELNDRYPTYAWADGSKQLLISEIRREANDLESLPAPSVVTMLNIETGDNPTVYKTGEKVEVESLRVLGGNDTYIFVVYDTPKNWVADDVNPPKASVQAVRLSDGAVQPVNTHQVVVENMQYNANDNTFITTGQNSEDEQKGYVTVATLEEGEFGLVLRKVFSLDTALLDSVNPVVTAKGMPLANYDTSSQPFKLVQDDGTITELKLINGDANGQLLSLQTMPDLSQAE